MLMDNDIVRNGFLLLCLGGLLAVWGHKPAKVIVEMAAAPQADEAQAFLDSKLSASQKRGISNASKLLDAALREQMAKVSKRVVNLLTVGPSAVSLESATVRKLTELFSKIQVRSVSDFKKAEELVGTWRQDVDNPPKELLPVLALGDLTIVQWLEQGSGGLQLNTWYVAKDKVLSRDTSRWVEGTLPQETIDKLRRVILSPELRADGWALL